MSNSNLILFITCIIFCNCNTSLQVSNSSEAKISNDITFWNVEIAHISEGGLFIQSPASAVKIIDQNIDTIFDVSPNYRCVKENNCFDLEHRYMIPGLIDAHVHLSLDFVTNQKEIQDCDKVNKFLEEYLKSGITTIVDLGMSPFVEDCIDKVIYSPNIIHVGQLFGESGTDACKEAHVTCPSSINKAVSDVKELYNQGREVVKIRKMSVNSTIRNSIIKAARELEMLVIEHQDIWNERLKIFRDTSILIPDAFAHAPPATLSFTSRDARIPFDERDTAEIVLDSMYKNEVTFISTILVEEHNRSINDGIKVLEMADQYGVKFALGTDAGIRPAHGSGFINEFDIIAKRLSWKDAFEAATISAARLLQKDKFIGNIRQGKLANLVILHRSNKNGIDLRDICMVINLGEVVWQSKKCGHN